jgi:hypothetical protein
MNILLVNPKFRLSLSGKILDEFHDVVLFSYHILKQIIWLRQIIERETWTNFIRQKHIRIYVLGIFSELKKQ